MTPDQLILNVVKAAEKLPNNTPYDEFIAESPENKEWADAFNALRDYAKTLEN